MKYIELNTGNTVWIHKIRALFPNMSIPDNADLFDIGYKRIEETEIPVKEGYVAVEVDPVDYKQTWTLVPVVENIPQSVTRLQAKLALLDMELLDRVEALIASDRRTKVYWDDAVTIERQNPTLLGMASILNLTDEDIDKLFIAASKIEA